MVKSVSNLFKSDVVDGSVSLGFSAKQALQNENDENANPLHMTSPGKRANVAAKRAFSQITTYSVGYAHPVRPFHSDHTSFHTPRALKKTREGGVISKTLTSRSLSFEAEPSSDEETSSNSRVVFSRQLNKLPSEILLNIIRRLPVHDILTMRSVSHVFNIIINTDTPLINQIFQPISFNMACRFTAAEIRAGDDGFGSCLVREIAEVDPSKALDLIENFESPSSRVGVLETAIVPFPERGSDLAKKIQAAALRANNDWWINEADKDETGEVALDASRFLGSVAALVSEGKFDENGQLLEGDPALPFLADITWIHEENVQRFPQLHLEEVDPVAQAIHRIANLHDILLSNSTKKSLSSLSEDPHTAALIEEVEDDVEDLFWEEHPPHPEQVAEVVARTRDPRMRGKAISCATAICKSERLIFQPILFRWLQDLEQMAQHNPVGSVLTLLDITKMLR